MTRRGLRIGAVLVLVVAGCSSTGPAAEPAASTAVHAGSCIVVGVDTVSFLPTDSQACRTPVGDVVDAAVVARGDGTDMNLTAGGSAAVAIEQGAVRLVVVDPQRRELEVSANGDAVSATTIVVRASTVLTASPQSCGECELVVTNQTGSRLTSFVVDPLLTGIQIRELGS